MRSVDAGLHLKMHIISHMLFVTSEHNRVLSHRYFIYQIHLIVRR